MNEVRKQLWLTPQVPFTGKDVRIGVIDSGVDLSHPDLKHAIDLSISAPTTALATTIEDYCYHGTHIAGIIAGSGFASSGKYRGIAPNTRLQILKAYNGASGLTADVARAVELAIDAKVDIINYSGGHAPEGSGPPPWVWPAKQSLVEDAFQHAAEAGILCVVAAGNHGDFPASINRPGGHPDVLTVGAIDPDGNVWRNSSRGPYLILPTLRANGQRRWDAQSDKGVEERPKPDIVMPGVMVVSCRAAQSKMLTQMQLIDPTDPNCPYVFESGTSEATAVATGMAALLLEAVRAEGIPLGANRGQTLKQLLMHAARKLQSGGPNDYGAGTIKWDVLYETLRDYAKDPDFQTVCQKGPGLKLVN